MIGEAISHYRIISKLGAGGMGEVYLAEDTRLGRQVALKFLPASYQYDPDRRTRFLHEARTASALRSPNIAAIYDIGEHDGVMFIVMEYVEGELLSTRIGRGPLALREAAEIAMQVADALDEAHALGIIHRDIKSSNLMVTPRGLVKMLDFGLAKMIRVATQDDSRELTAPLGQATSPGIVLGTVSYMSPEQAFGRDLDNRSDIFSLGIVIYEMLAGQLPFKGASVTEIVDNIIHQEPLPIASFNSNVPVELERITRHCLEKDREQRYSSARELAVDLRAFLRETDSGSVRTSSSTAAQTQRRVRSRRAIDSIAVLPFLNASGDADTEYLSDGVTESIINNLSRLPRLRVMARSTVFRYKGREIDPLKVGRELNVRALLTGRVLQRGDLLIIKAEMVDTSDGAQVWGEQYNRQLSDIFAIEEEISNVISEKLKLKLTGPQRKQLTRRYTENTEAYQLYLKGRFYWNKRTEESLKRGIEYFNQAIETDPNYALAYAGVADSYNILASYSALAPKDAFPRAKAAATRALELDEKLAEAHASLAFALFGYDWNWAEAEKQFKRAIQLSPNYANGHHWYAVFLAPMERFDEAFVEINRAQELDPLSLPINTSVGWLFHLARRFDEAITVYQKTLEIEPGFGLAHRRLAQTYEQVGKHAEAEAEFQAAEKCSGEDAELIAARGHFYAKTGEQDKARRELARLNEMAASRYVPAYLIARIHIALGEMDEAFKLLNAACEERYGYLIYLKADPVFDPLREDARFAELVRRVGLD
ncbi:MAG TPA: protein kinase [Blastocatellia bacterium]|nr:protein kinase [Blastocatellia bacterium]